MFTNLVIKRINTPKPGIQILKTEKFMLKLSQVDNGAMPIKSLPLTIVESFMVDSSIKNIN